MFSLVGSLTILSEAAFKCSVSVGRIAFSVRMNIYFTCLLYSIVRNLSLMSLESVNILFSCIVALEIQFKFLHPTGFKTIGQACH